MAKTDANSGILLTLDRGIRVLEHIAQSEGRATAKEVSRSLGINPGTTYQLLRTLQANGYVNRGAGGRYELGMRVGYLLDQYTARAAPPQALLEFLEDVHSATDETVYMSMVSGSEIKIVASLEGTQRLRVGKSNVGYSAHPHARASGKAFLAYCDRDKLETYLPNRELPALTQNTITDWDQLLTELEAVRLRGVAHERGEFEPEVACIASVIIDEEGNPIGAYAASLPSARFLAQKNAMATELLRVGEAASRWLGYKGEYPLRAS
jgi:IclR family acetate operon transcriptional repressor